MEKIILIGLLLALSSGCVPKGGLESDFRLTGSSKSVLIFGYKQGDINLQFFKGEVQDGLYLQNQFASATYLGSGENGYVVFKAKPSSLLALPAYVHKKESVFSKITFACNDDETILIRVPESPTVMYIADLKVGEYGYPFTLKTSIDFMKAKKDISKLYPQVADDLILGNFERIKSGGSCTLDVVVPIYSG